jgi:hypothetical protein
LEEHLLGTDVADKVNRTLEAQPLVDKRATTGTDETKLRRNGYK